MPTPKPALEEWIPKAAAAKLLGMSLRQIERREKEGFIEKRTLDRLPTESTGRVVYSRADLIALKAGTPNTHARVVADAPAPHMFPGSEFPAAERNALAVVRQPQAPADPFAGLAAHLARLSAAFPSPAAVVAALKPWLTLDEAVEFSGLTRPWLLHEAEAGQGSIAIRDMGKHTRGGRWRFLRDDLGKAE